MTINAAAALSATAVMGLLAAVPVDLSALPAGVTAKAMLAGVPVAD